MTGQTSPHQPQDFEAQWQARFDRFAARGGSDATISGWSEHGLARRLEAINQAFDLWPLKSAAHVVDLGCGTGVYALLMRDRGFRPIGADFSMGMLKRAQIVTRDGDGEGEAKTQALIPLVAASLNELPFAAESFEGLISVGVLQHLSSLNQACPEMARVLKPQGRAYLITLNGISGHAVASASIAWPRAWVRRQILPKKHAVRRSSHAMTRIYQAHGMKLLGLRGLYLFPSGCGFFERFFTKLEWLKNPFTKRPLFLPLANAILYCFEKE